MPRLYSCKARVGVRDITVVVSETKELVKIKGAFVLQSYSSLVAVYDPWNAQFYLLPRWDYSTTTFQHLRKFHDYVHEYYYGACFIRNMFKQYKDTNFYIKCDGFYNGLFVERY